MAAFVDTTVKEIDNRLSDLRDEISKLQAARAALAGNGGVRRTDRRRTRRRARATTSQPAAATSTRPVARRRQATARRGGRSATRATQTVELVRSKPGITIPELAKAMKIQPNYLYRVLPKLAADGQVKRDGKGWRAAS
jgi:hypothetical protein